MTAEELNHYAFDKESYYFDRKSARKDVAEIAKHVIAFANAGGGTLVIGIEDDGAITGFKRDKAHAIEDFEQVPIMMCVPSPVVSPERVAVKNASGEDDLILVLNIEPSIDHVIEQRTDGRVALREGDKSVWLDRDQVAALQRDKGQTFFENEICQDAELDELDHEAIAIYKQALGTTVSDEQLLRSKHFLKNGKLTNAGVLLFVKEPSYILPQARLRVLKIDGTVMKSGANMNIIKDKTFDGPLIKALPAAKEFIASQLRDFQFQQKGGKFTVVPEYPEYAWFEGLVNAMAHRDYSIRGEYARVYIFDDRMEIFSPGKLPNIVTVDNIRHTRFSRNPQIARVFTAFEWVRELNEGIDKIYEVMEANGLPEPEFVEENKFSVRMILRNNIENRIPRLQEDSNDTINVTVNDRVNDRVNVTVKRTPAKVLAIIEANPEVTAEDMAGQLGLTERTVRRALKTLQDQGVIERVGSDKTGSWVTK